jgi:DnaJ homolog subfamily A member 2
LSDVEKRAKYDKYGLEGLDDGGGADHAADAFSMFFGGRGHRAAAPRRGEDMNHPIRVSLEDLYNGKTIKLAVNREVLEGQPRMCPKCDGHGSILQLRQIGIGIVQQIQRSCPDCSGEGYVCRKRKERKVLEVLIEKGMKHNQKITFRGMGDEKPNMEPGNINFVVQEKDHDVFKRKGADLLIQKTVSLKEALTGCSWKITHLDGRHVVIQSRPGEIIQAEAVGGKPYVKVIPNEGMPSPGNPFVKGGLYVLFTVEFPQSGELSDAAIKALRKALPGPSMEVDYDEKTDEIVHMEEADVKMFGLGGVPDRNTAHESDEEDGGGEAVQCHQS